MHYRVYCISERCVGYFVLMSKRSVSRGTLLGYRAFGTDSAFVKERRIYQEQLHQLRKRYGDDSRRRMEALNFERQQKARESRERQQVKSAAYKERLEVVKEKLRDAVKTALPPQASASGIVEIIPRKLLQSLSEEYTFGMVMVARQALDRERIRAQLSEQELEQTERKSIVQQRRMHAQQFAKMITMNAKRMSIARLLTEDAKHWVTPDRLDASVEAVVRDLMSLTVSNRSAPQVNTDQ